MYKIVQAAKTNFSLENEKIKQPNISEDSFSVILLFYFMAVLFKGADTWK
jgi:hypothetical protein